MTNNEKYKNEVVEGFRQHKGRCYARIYPPINPTEIVCEIVGRYIVANPEDKILVAVTDYTTRKAILDCLTKNNISVANTKILSRDYINVNYAQPYNLIVTVGINNSFGFIRRLSVGCRFMFVVITKNELDVEFNNGLDKLLPVVNPTVKAAQVDADNIYSPVEECLVPIPLDDEDRIQYNKYTEYITTSITIFGGLDTIDKCKHGDPKFNISSTEYRNAVARGNGWSNDLDTSIEFNKRIDELYNPNVLFERATTVYNIIRERRRLVTNNKVKLHAIEDIIVHNPDKKIIIVSKYAEFAAEITKFLNRDGIIKCGDYHDCIADTIDINLDGTVKLIKSGVNAGKTKVIKAAAISTLNLRLFNQDVLSILSIKNSSNNKIACDADIIIITSPLCEPIYELKTRFRDIHFNSIPNIVYTLYSDDSIEQDAVNKIKETPLHKLISENKDAVKYNDATGDVFI
jgi:hypothetical protein